MTAAKGGRAGGESPTPASPDPRSTADLLGHEPAEAAVLEAATTGRLAHAWLISGPRGIGKATLAFRIARWILAGGMTPGGPAPSPPPPQPSPTAPALDLALAPQATPPGDAPVDPGEALGRGGLFLPPEHPVFRRIAAGAHADLRVVERGWMDDKGGGATSGREARRRSEIVVGDVRAVASFMALTAAEGGWRVVIVDGAEEMNRNAANALLKTLEEPPERAVLLLVSHNPARLLPTIRSRCRRLTLAPLAPPVLDALLRRHQPELSETERATLIGLSEGSLGRALDLCLQGGLEVFGDLLGLLEQAPGGRAALALHALGDRAARDDRVFSVLADLLPWWLARMVRAAARQSQTRDAAGGGEGTPALFPAPSLPNEDRVARRLLAAAPLDRWVEVWEKVSALFERSRAVHLDRKHTVLSAFFLVERAAGRS